MTLVKCFADRVVREGRFQYAALLFLVALAFGPVVLTAGPAGANTPAESVSLTVATAGQSGWLKQTIAAGSRWTGYMQVTDTSPISETVDVYPVDGLTAANTGIVYSNQGQPLVSGVGATASGSWLHLGVSSAVNLTPGETLAVPVTVDVPAGASPGNHVAGVAAQPTVPLTSSSGHLTIQTVERVVVAVAVTVPGGVPFNLQIGTPSLSTDSQMQIPLTNTGQLFARPQVGMSVHCTDGQSLTVRKKMDNILPAQTGYLLQSLPANWPTSGCTATITGQVNGGQPVSVTYNLGLTSLVAHSKEAIQANPPPALRSDLIHKVLVGSGIAILLALGGLAVLAWRRRGADGEVAMYHLAQ